jgi:hypothetical protein
MVFCAAAYGTGAGAVRVSLSGAVWSCTQMWRNTALESHWMTPVWNIPILSDGRLYARSTSMAVPLVVVANNRSVLGLANCVGSHFSGGGAGEDKNVQCR